MEIDCLTRFDLKLKHNREQIMVEVPGAFADLADECRADGFPVIKRNDGCYLERVNEVDQ